MAATSPYDDTAIPLRVHELERDVARVDTTVQKHEVALATQAVQTSHLTNAVADLKGAVTWNNRGLLGLCLTIASTAVAAILHFG